VPDRITADVVVVGLGAMGSACLDQLARRGAGVVGIDRFAPPHDRGSSHGESRITRQAIAEGDEYVPFVLRSHEIWRQLEADSGQTLFLPVGALFLGRPGDAARHHGQADFVGRTAAVARRHGIAHELLTTAQVQARFPQFRLVGDEVAYWEPGAGLLRPERCIAVQLERARALGATVRTGETVVAVVPDAAGVRVETDRATYAADRAVVAAGAWLPGLLGGAVGKRLTVHRQVLCWFAAREPAAFAPGRFPVFIWIHGGAAADLFYGFPILGDGVKLATEQFVEATDPDRVARAVSPAEIGRLYAQHVRDRLPGVSDRCVRTATCLYTTAPDWGFVIDHHPDSDRIVVASPCSGHGFKHSPAIGEAIAERLTTGTSRLDLAPFRLARLAG
jgi:sarcosine oxidase